MGGKNPYVKKIKAKFQKHTLKGFGGEALYHSHNQWLSDSTVMEKETIRLMITDGFTFGPVPNL